MPSVCRCSRKGKEKVVSSSPYPDISGESSPVGDLVMTHQSALRDTAGFDFDQMQLVLHAEETFRADREDQEAGDYHTDEVAIVSSDLENGERIRYFKNNKNWIGIESMWLPLFPFQLWNHPSRRKKKKSAKKARTDKSAEISAKSVEENIDKSTHASHMNLMLIAKGLEVPKEMMDQLARDEAKYDKEINDMEVKAEPIQYEDSQEKAIDKGVEVPKEKVDDHNGHGTYDPPIKSGKGAQTSRSSRPFAELDWSSSAYGRTEFAVDPARRTAELNLC
ncbi:hypothetical protein HID58_066734 [Brassica napus]|uniref:Uncharacterized protein n=1 Tax=Brassica napus TaxID=3708 RepID=A0ABQ7ZH00_BRANA|nr:hypothetical protein HID58_066734 [Brassica napus]